MNRVCIFWATVLPFLTDLNIGSCRLQIYEGATTWECCERSQVWPEVIAADRGAGDNINLGLAVTGGKKYENLFRKSICINMPIVMSIPQGYIKLVGTAGYSDDSFNNKALLCR
jgi:hypothetical protein